MTARQLTTDAVVCDLHKSAQVWVAWDLHSRMFFLQLGGTGWDLVADRKCKGAEPPPPRPLFSTMCTWAVVVTDSPGTRYDGVARKSVLLIHPTPSIVQWHDPSSLFSVSTRRQTVVRGPCLAHHSRVKLEMIWQVWEAEEEAKRNGGGGRIVIWKNPFSTIHIAKV